MTRELRERLAIQSWCFRGFKEHGQVVDALRACGLANLEISNAHLNPFTQGDAELDRVLEFYRSAGVTLSSCGVFGIGPDEARSRRAFEFARRIGLTVFSSDIAPGGVALAERLSAEFGIRLAIHNHGRRHRYGPAWALEELLAGTTENIGLCLDTAWLLDAGVDPVAFLRKNASRVYGVHVKDFVFDRAGKPADVIVGQGNLDLDAFVAALAETGFQGYFTLEFEGDVNDPTPATKQCVEAIRGALDRQEATGPA